MSTQIISEVRKAFESHFGRKPNLLVRAPGRINLIGEHTDYNEGFVLPAAIDREIVFAIGPSEKNEPSQMIALDIEEKHAFETREINPLPSGSWQNYILGVVAEIQKIGQHVPGFNMTFAGNIPSGAGMSSSAALECGTCFALNELFDLGLLKEEMVLISQKAEHNYVGVQCGIMDQFASMMGKEGQAIKLDCRSLEFDYFPVDLDNHTIVICNSNVQHNLADSAYNERRNQCEEGVHLLKKEYEGMRSLRDITWDKLNAHKDKLPEVIFRRCKYIVEENERVKAFCKALEARDTIKAGAILKNAQMGMETEYEITCREIDFMTFFANEWPYATGARMMGGGFGGCTINLIQSGYEHDFVKELGISYKHLFNQEITPIFTKISQGVSSINIHEV